MEASNRPDPTDPEKRGAASEAAKRRVEAAQLRADLYLAAEEREDGRQRAKGLVSAVLVYSLFYPIVVWLVFKRTYPGAGVTDKDVFPLWAAMLYAIFMSLATLWTGFQTAMR